MSKSDVLYTDLLPHFRAFFAGLSELKVLARKPLNPTHSVILVHALVHPSKAVTPSTPESFKQEAFGLFVIDNTSSRLYMPIEIFGTHRWLDYEVILEEADERHVDIRRQGATYGDVADRVRYFLDLRRQRVLGAVSHHGMSIYDVTLFQGMLYFLGTPDSETTILVRAAPPQPSSSTARLSSFEVVDRIDGQRIQAIRAVRVEGDRLILTGDNRQYVLRQGRWTVQVNPDVPLFKYNPAPQSGTPIGVPFIAFWVPLYMVQEQIVPLPATGVPSRRFLVWNGRISANSAFAPFLSPGIYEMTAGAHKFFQLPQPSYDLFARYRPKRVEDGYTKDVAILGTQIVSFQLEGRRIWFGLTFGETEGFTGVGGIGYFDTERRDYRLTYMREIADWSTSAILVEPGAIWLGLEGAAGPGGLARYDRRTREVLRYRIPAHVNVIRRFGDRLYLGTSDGIYVVADGKVEHVRLKVELGGKYSVHIERK